MLDYCIELFLVLFPGHIAVPIPIKITSFSGPIFTEAWLGHDGNVRQTNLVGSRLHALLQNNLSLISIGLRHFEDSFIVNICNKFPFRPAR